MKAIEFTSSLGDNLTIEGNNIKVINKFGETYKGHLDENGKIICRGKFSLGYLLRAMEEYKLSNNNGK